jgi:hypothetical protein
MRPWACAIAVVLAVLGFAPPCAVGESGAAVEVGLATRDVTPEGPIWLAGYAARKRASEKVDTRLVVQACALKGGGERVVLVSLDNCEVSREFMAPVLQGLETREALRPGAVMVVSSHTHSAPVLEGPLRGMYPLDAEQRERVQRYGEFLRKRLVEVVQGALADMQPALLEHGVGRATFAMNRRVYKGDRIEFGENPDGPVDWDVPVMRIRGTNGTLRAILFGYACHGTSIHGDDFYIVSGDYIAYARQHLEAVYPGAMAMYLTGMGADSNPSPRGTLLDAKRHGLELAGAVVGVLGRPMRQIGGAVRLAYAEIDLPLEGPPTQAQLEQDAKSEDVYVRHRAMAYLELLKGQRPLPAAVEVPLAVVRVGNDLTFVAMGGEVVVDYAVRFKRLFAADHPWLIGYAYEIPCYIPSVRILREGGYEAQQSLVYYGLYGPLRSQVEERVLTKMGELVASVRGR